MTTRIRCTTLFDITPTGVQQRRQPQGLSDAESASWRRQQSQQANYDTVLQVVNLRSQPEVAENPRKIVVDNTQELFGLQHDSEESSSVWEFTFEVQHAAVFKNYDGDLGALFLDCDGVPMITGLDETADLPNFLDTTPELRNIYFEIVDAPDAE